MTLRVFLKPNLRKILVFAILIGIFFLIPIEYKTGPRICDCSDPISCAECSGPDETIVKTSLGTVFLNLFFVYNPYMPYEIILSALIGLIPIFGVYLLSCILISAYDKLKSKK